MRKFYLLFLLFSLSFATTAQQRAFIATNQAELRQNPALNSSLLLKLPKGAPVLVQKPTNLQLWRYVAYTKPNGKKFTGYILKEYLRFGSGELNAHGVDVLPRCTTVSLSGLRCKRRTSNRSKICTQHRDQNKRTTRAASTRKSSGAVRCSATTRKGTQCKRRTKNSSGRCWQHE